MNKSIWMPCGLLCSLVLLAGCGGIKKFPTAPVTGQILCEDKPIPFAHVYFEPIADGNSAVVGKPGFAIADENGKFTLGTYSTEDGAVVGRHRVKIDPPNPGANPDGWSCDCKMSSNEIAMETEIVDGDNNVEVVLKASKKSSSKEMSEEELEEMMDGEDDD